MTASVRYNVAHSMDNSKKENTIRKIQIVKFKAEKYESENTNREIQIGKYEYGNTIREDTNLKYKPQK